jgi:cobalamin synthase
LSDKVVGNEPRREIIELADVVDRVFSGDAFHRHWAIWRDQAIGPIAASCLAIILASAKVPVTVK